MDKFYIKILMIEEKIEKNHKTQSLIKITAFMLLFFIGVCSANPDRTTF